MDDHPALPVVGKNCELVCNQYFSWLGQFLVLSVLQAKLHASEWVFVFTSAVSSTDYSKSS